MSRAVKMPTDRGDMECGSDFVFGCRFLIRVRPSLRVTNEKAAARSRIAAALQNYDASRFARSDRTSRMRRNASYPTVAAPSQIRPAAMPAATSEIQCTPR